MTGFITNKADYLRRIRWEIPNYFSHSQKADTFLQSPEIHFLSRTWHLRVYPNGMRSNSSVEWVGLYLLETTPGSSRSIALKFRFFFEYDEDGKCARYPSDSLSSYTNNVNGVASKQVLYGSSKFIRRTELHRRAEMVADGVLMRILVEVEATGSFDSFDTLANDFLALLRDEEKSDVTIKAGGQSFKVHKLILGARSAVFAKAFGSLRLGKGATDVIDVGDSEPETFRLFLEFIYTGRLESLSSANVSGILTLAGKYDLPDLKEKCLAHMKDNLSLETVCDVLDAAHRHGEEELLASAKDLLLQNAKEVMRTEKWIEFVKSNPTLCTEILLSFVPTDNKMWRRWASTPSVTAN